MVDAKEQTRIAIAQMLTHIEGLEYFEGKHKLVSTIIELEWSLRSPVVLKEVSDDLPEELNGGHEAGWGG